MSYDFTISHKPGLGNISDFHSRHPTDVKHLSKDDTADFINLLVQQITPKSISKEEILQGTLVDKLLTKLSNAIKTGIFNDKELNASAIIHNEFSITNEGLILRDTRLVIPESLLNRVIDIAHEGHLGIVKTKLTGNSSRLQVYKIILSGN